MLSRTDRSRITPTARPGSRWIEPGRAEQAFMAALRINFRLGGRLGELWHRRYRQGDIETAKTAIAPGVARRAGHHAATANLGGLMRISGRAQSAEALLREALARRSGQPWARD